MALKTVIGLPAPAPTGPKVDGATWACVSHSVTVPIDVETVRRMVRDVRSWPLWQRRVVSAVPLEGGTAIPGSIHRLGLGFPALQLRVVHMLVDSDEDTTVFAGGRGAWRFIEVVTTEPVGDSTRLERRIDIRLPPRLGAYGLGAARRLVSRLARRHLELAASALK